MLLIFLIFSELVQDNKVLKIDHRSIIETKFLFMLCKKMPNKVIEVFKLVK